MPAFRGMKSHEPPPATDPERSASEASTVDDPVVPTYSVSFRLQRTTTEVAFVSVPMTADLMIEQPVGTGRIDVAKMVQRAIEVGQAPGIAWQPESQQVQPHPIQTPPPGLAGTAEGGEA
jgi:hypothetical protein